jgi:hypothetical protein
MTDEGFLEHSNLRKELEIHQAAPLIDGKPSLLYYDM